jgi:hypothetical protein
MTSASLSLGLILVVLMANNWLLIAETPPILTVYQKNCYAGISDKLYLRI